MTVATAIPSAAEVEHRLRAALSEFGCADALLVPIDSAPSDGWPRFKIHTADAPFAVWWTALAIVYPSHACWSCHSANSRDKQAGSDCVEGNCHHPEGPSRPPRHLLVPRGNGRPV